jgi:tetratricopeptide (TPR) repeat protein
MKINYYLLKVLLIVGVMVIADDTIFGADDKKTNEMRREAQRLEKDGNYDKAHEIYASILRESKTPSNLIDEVRVLIALDSAEKAAPLCRQALEYKEVPVIAHAYWGQIQMTQRNYAEALQAFKVYEGKGGKDASILKLKLQCEKILSLSKGAAQYVVRNEKKLNSDFNDFGPSMYGNIVIFSSNRPYKIAEKLSPVMTEFCTYELEIPPGMFISEYDKRDISHLSDKDRIEQLKIQQDEILAAMERIQNNDGTANSVNLFISSITKYPEWTRPEATPITLNLYKNNGPASFASSGNTLYTSYVNNDGQKILKASHKMIDKKEWTFPMLVRLPKGWEKSNICSQCVSADGGILVISAEGIRNSEGGYDLYMCRMQADGHWGTPENLGNTINSRGDEMFPSFDAEGRLYFSSTGHGGLGGADIFRTNGAINNWTTIENMGAPINSPRDDYGIMFYPNSSTSGLFVSNRSGGMGNDDIYSFDKIHGTNDKTAGIIAVKVMNKDTKSPVDGVNLTLVTDKNETYTAVTALNGQAFFAVTPNRTYAISAYVKDDLYAPLSKIKGGIVKAGATTDHIIMMTQIKFKDTKKSKVTKVTKKKTTKKTTKKK